MSATPESLAKVAALLGWNLENIAGSSGWSLYRHRKGLQSLKVSDADLIMAILTALAKRPAINDLATAADELVRALRVGRDPLAAVIAAAVGEEG